MHLRMRSVWIDFDGVWKHIGVTTTDIGDHFLCRGIKKVCDKRSEGWQKARTFKWKLLLITVEMRS